MVSNCKKMFWNNQSRLDYVEHLQSLESGTEVGGGAHTMSSIQTGRLWSIFTADDINMEVFILSRRVPFCPEKRNANKSFFAQTEESSGNWDSPLKTTHCTWKERCHERNNLPSAAEDLNIDIHYTYIHKFISMFTYGRLSEMNFFISCNSSSLLECIKPWGSVLVFDCINMIQYSDMNTYM